MDSPTWQAGEDTITPFAEIEQGHDGLELWVSASESRAERRMAVLIPHCLFDTPRLSRGKLRPRVRAAVLKQYGWTQDEPTDVGEYGQIAGDFEHRYLTVTVRYI